MRLQKKNIWVALWWKSDWSNKHKSTLYQQWDKSDKHMEPNKKRGRWPRQNIRANHKRVSHGNKKIVATKTRDDGLDVED